jgi:hypothetical protein
MKKRYTQHWLIWMSLPLLFSCGETKKETIEEKTDTVATVQPAPTQILAKYGTRLQKIVKSDAGILRGVNFGDNAENVKTIESIAPLEDSTDHLGYRIDLGNYEDLDVRYHLNPNQQVWGFTLDIYLDEQASVDSLFNDFRNYFSERFGTNNFDNQRNMVAWNMGDSLKVVVKDVGIKQAPGLQVQMMNLKGAKEATNKPVQ